MADPASRFVVILPVRNGAGYVGDAIRSVVAQDWADWRLVVFENASTDGTMAEIEAIDDHRIEIRPADRPLSMHENWRRGYELAGTLPRGTLITFLGHDDLLMPTFLAQIAMLIRASPDATLYQTHFDLIDERGAVMRPCRPIPDRESWTTLLAELCWYQRDSFGTGYVMRAHDYRTVGGIPDTPLLLFADHLLFTRLTRMGHKVSSLERGFAYRRHLGSTSGLPSEAKFAAHLRSLALFVRHMDDEFAEFTVTGCGQAALAALLARELALLNVGAVRRTFSSADLAILRELLSRYEAVADGVPLATLAGHPYSPARPLMALRSFNVTQKLWRYKLRHRLKPSAR